MDIMVKWDWQMELKKMKAVLKSDGIQLVRVESGALFVMIAGILGKVLQVSTSWQYIVLGFGYYLGREADACNKAHMV